MLALHQDDILNGANLVKNKIEKNGVRIYSRIQNICEESEHFLPHW